MVVVLLLTIDGVAITETDDGDDRLKSYCDGMTSGCDKASEGDILHFFCSALVSVVGYARARFYKASRIVVHHRCGLSAQLPAVGLHWCHVSTHVSCARLAPIFLLGIRYLVREEHGQAVAVWVGYL